MSADQLDLYRRRMVGPWADLRGPFNALKAEAVYEFSSELHRTQQVSDATWTKAKALFSEQQILDLIATCGFYVMISMVLNVAQAGIPGGEALPLK